MPAQREHLVDVSVGKLQQQSPLRTQELPIQKRTEKDEVPVVREGQQLLAGLLRQGRPIRLGQGLRPLSSRRWSRFLREGGRFRSGQSGLLRGGGLDGDGGRRLGHGRRHLPPPPGRRGWGRRNGRAFGLRLGGRRPGRLQHQKPDQDVGTQSHPRLTDQAHEPGHQAPQDGLRPVGGLRLQVPPFLLGDVQAVEDVRPAHDEPEVPHQGEELLQYPLGRGSLRHHPLHVRKGGASLSAQRRKPSLQGRPASPAQGRLDVLQADVPIAPVDDLLQHGERIAEGSIRLARHLPQGLGLGVRPLPFDDLTEAVEDPARADAVERDVLAPRTDRHRDLVGLRGGQDEHHVGGRLLQRLEKGVEGRHGQHVHLVDDVDLVFRGERGQGHVGLELPDLVDAVVGGAVDLDHVQALPSRNGLAAAAAAARLPGLRRKAVQRLGQNTGHGGLAAAPRSREQVGVPHPRSRQGSSQDFDCRRLAGYLRKPLRTISTI